MTKQPSYRFAGYTESWVEKKLGEIVERITRINKNLESDLPLTISAQYGLIDQETFFNKKVASKDVSGYYLLKKGEFAYNKSYSSDYPWGAVKRLDNYEMGVLSTLYIVFRPNSIDSDFLAVYYDSPKWYKEVSMRAAEGARNHGLLNISPQDFFDTELIFPVNQSEQIAIGSFFQDIDQLINLQQRKLEVLKEQKKTYLKLLFPAKGQTKPALRFAGFEDDWKEVKLGDFVEISKGIQRNKEFLSPNADNKNCYPVYNGGKQESGYTDEFNREGNIMISEGGASAGFVNYFDGKYWSGGHNFTIDELENNIHYVLALLESQQQELYSLQVGSGLPNIQLNSLKKVIIAFPDFQEQEAIGSFFQDLDKAIAKQEEKVKNLKESKQTLLRKMFI